MPKRQILVIYGGRSAEHEVSCRSAAFILKNLDRKKYDIKALAINKDGFWLPQDAQKLLADMTNSVPIKSEVSIEPTQALGQSKENVVVIPILHGTFGEDGTLQGLLDMAEVAYVGADTCGSAVGMDKVIAKKLAASVGIPIVPYIDVREQAWQQEKEKVFAFVASQLGYPIFVKPVRLGSSVGISKVKDETGLEAACLEAFQFDEKILIEKGLEDIREIECAALGDYDPEISVPGEIHVKDEFYSYEAKYSKDDSADIVIPANIDAEKTEEVCLLSKRIFQVLELYGMARIDLFLENKTDNLYFNEVNTIPGFTEISQYPQLWQESGVPPAQLLDRLIKFAIKRKEKRAKLKREY